MAPAEEVADAGGRIDVGSAKNTHCRHRLPASANDIDTGHGCFISAAKTM